ncbi:MAG: IclR family transcriptional regulator [Ilumatobacteraceae bacterium]|nr:IclR family transcriptional regulator [Ilumatobacteraceae bacterium]
MGSANSGIQSIERAFSVMLAVATEPAGITDVARRVALPVSTVARLLSTLEHLEAVIRQDDGVTYRIGPTVSSLAAGNDSTLSGRARPFLDELVERVHETAGLSVLEGNEVLYLDHVENDNAVQIRDWTGERTPLHVVASGLVFLAFMPAERVKAYTAGGLDAPTEHSIDTAAQLDKRLDGVRKAGLAWTVDELQLGISAVAAPVRNRKGEVVAAIHCHGPTYRFPDPDGRAEVEAAVSAAARRLSDTGLD